MLLVQHTDELHHPCAVGRCRAWLEHAGIVKFSRTLAYPHGIICVPLLMLFACTQRMLSVILLVRLKLRTALGLHWQSGVNTFTSLLFSRERLRE